MLASSGLQTLMDELLMDQLKSCGYRVVSPVMCDQAIVYGDNALFGHAVGPQSWKNCYVHPCNGSGRARRDERSWCCVDAPPASPLQSSVRCVKG